MPFVTAPEAQTVPSIQTFNGVSSGARVVKVEPCFPKWDRRRLRSAFAIFGIIREVRYSWYPSPRQGSEGFMEVRFQDHKSILLALEAGSQGRVIYNDEGRLVHLNVSCEDSQLHADSAGTRQALESFTSRIDQDVPQASSNPDERFSARCAVCRITFTTPEEQQAHQNERSHQVREQLRGVLSDRTIFNDKGPIEIRQSPDTPRKGEASAPSSPFLLDFGLCDKNGSMCTIVANVINKSVAPRRINDIVAIPNNMRFTFSDPGNASSGNPAQIPPLGTYPVQISAPCDETRDSTLLLVFVFDGFRIARFLHLTVAPEQEFEELKPTEPYVRDPTVHVPVDNEPTDFIPGEPAPKPTTIKRTAVLKQYVVPRYIKEAVIDGPHHVAHLVQQAGSRSHLELLHLLLYLEEIQMQVDIRKYDMEHARLRPAGTYLSLKVVGLAERRPSILYNDRVFASLSKECRPYEGFVHRVQEEDILLRFNYELHSNEFRSALPYNIRFTFSRGPLRRMHDAIDRAASLPFLAAAHSHGLLPASRHSSTSFFGRLVSTASRLLEVARPAPPSYTSASVLFFDQNLNDEQKTAVVNVLNCSHAQEPYLIHGPPGTGKTKTLVECILQVVRKNPKTKVLSCAPSNSASDLLAVRLKAHLGIHEMVRLNAYQRGWDSVPEEIALYCPRRDTHSTFHQWPALEDIKRFRVVVTTCVSAGVLSSMGMGTDHFSHIFLDEAGQAVEPESLIPLVLAGRSTSMILAGDHKQLGPIIRSRHALEHKYDVSLCERLSVLPTYRLTGQETTPFACRLLHNYRSHEKILELPSRLFYDSSLIPAANPLVTGALTAWDGLPNKNGFPIVFFGLEGKDQQEKDSPSFFNVLECLKVLEFVEKVIAYRRFRVAPEDIGVITPYRKQVLRIRQLFRKKNLEKVKVGSVEEFQGQERLVVIISTVRSSVNWLAYDETFSLGFLKNPKRFNVAITRAKALLIVVGNPTILAKDKYWKALIQYCRANGGYSGCPPPPGTDASPTTTLASSSTGDHNDHDTSMSAALSRLGIAPESGPTDEDQTGFHASSEDPEWHDAR